MNTSVRRRPIAVAAALLIGAAGLIAPAEMAVATNAGTTQGVRTTGCAVDWRADGILTRHGESMPEGLRAQNASGAYDYSNSGFVSEVSDATFGHPGWMEFQHFYTGSGSNTAQNWRLPVATSHTVLDATITVRLPEGVTWVNDPGAVKVASAMRPGYSWSVIGAERVEQQGTTATIHLGTLAAGTGVVVQFRGAVSPEQVATGVFEASSSLSGTYVEGQGCSNADLPPIAQPTPADRCQVVLTGRSIRALGSRDVDARLKDDTLPGEVNGDSWAGDVRSWGGVNADGWSDAGRPWWRAYAASDIDLVDVSFSTTAVRGVTFADTATFATHGGGALPRVNAAGKAYAGTVSGAGTIVRSSDGSSLSATVATMPAWSSFSLTAAAIPDGTGQRMILDHVLTGTIPNCDPTPAPTTDPTPDPTPTSGTTPVPTTDPTTPVGPPASPAPSPTQTPRPTSPASPPSSTPTPPTSTAVPTTPTPPTTPTTPTPTDAPTPTATPTPTGTPTAPGQGVRMVTRHFQVDRYMPRTARQARAVASLDDDGLLTYREDRALWGASRWQFVSVTVPANASAAHVRSAINAKTSAKVGDITGSARLRSIKPGRQVVIAWELGRGAAPVHGKAWGPTNVTAQRFVGRS